MIYAQHFFIGSQYMGTTPRRYTEFHKTMHEGQPFDVHSQAWFCNQCGEVWARAVLEDAATGESYPYRIEFHGCAKHPDPLHRTPPGSIRSWYKNLLPYLPDDMIRYEFGILMKYLDESESDDQ